MRTPTLQYLYLQKPVTLIIVICIIAVIPWIGLGDFSTKGEPREAAVAISMLESGNWILPQSYADEFAYKPPMAHWLMAIFSYPQGHVTEFSSRLPSALAFIALITWVLVFFGKRIEKFQEAFISTLLLVTCIEIHRAAMTTRVDMLLTTFIVVGLFQLYRWEEKMELKDLPLQIPLLLGCAVLTKGPVGIILPLFVFGVYLLCLRKYDLLTIFKALLYAGVSSLFLPLLWYIAAWKQGGDNFLNVVLAENFGRFFHLDTPNIAYDLGHENGVWYNFVTLIAGFMPWTIFFFFSLFGFKFKKPGQNAKELGIKIKERLKSMDKIYLFCLVAIVCILFFYSIPSSKRSVYLMPAYPFISLFLTRYALYLTENRTKVTRIFAALIAATVTVALVAVSLTIMGQIDPVSIGAFYTDKASLLETIEDACLYLTPGHTLSWVIIGLNLAALATLFYQMSKKINIKILYATIFVTFMVNTLIDGVIMRGVRQGGSCKEFSKEIMANFPLNKDNTFVMNNLKSYRNLYGANFYMGNIFRNFEKERPTEGYFLGGEKEMEKVLANYGDLYQFDQLAVSDKKASELRQKIALYRFQRKTPAP